MKPAMDLIQVSAWNDSGGGFTHRLFDGHPDLRVWPFELLLGRDDFPVDLFSETWFRGRFRWPRLQKELAIGDADILFDAISDSELKAVLQFPETAKHSDFKLDVSLGEWRRLTAVRWDDRQDRTQGAFLESYINAFFEASGGDDMRPVLGHCPIAILDAPEMWADFPKAKLIHVIRSPFGGFADMRRRHPSLDPTQYALKWSLINGTAAMCAGKYPNRVKLVTLLQLVEDTEAVMRRLSGWLGLPFHEALLTPTWRGRLLDQTRMGPFGGAPNIAAAARDEGAADLTSDERQIIWDITAGVMQLLGAFRTLPIWNAL